LKLATGWLSLFRRRTQPYYAFVRQLEASRGFVCASRLGEIRAPMLILHGTKDRIAPFRLAEEMRAGIPSSKLVKFEGGHAFPVFHRERFISEVFTFLKGA
jgi:pimeloyl-ACP methyl ester carboxylesterase